MKNLKLNRIKLSLGIPNNFFFSKSDLLILKILDLSFNKFQEVTSMLVTDVGDEMCW